jgi:Leucine-rich repeat (LRR) protein
MKELRILDLSFNKISGAIPTSIGEMTSLKNLNYT